MLVLNIKLDYENMVHKSTIFSYLNIWRFALIMWKNDEELKVIMKLYSWYFQIQCFQEIGS